MNEKEQRMNSGRIVRVVGPVIDVEFAPDAIPPIYTALKVDAESPAGHIDVVAEVQQHLPGQPGPRRRHVVDRRHHSAAWTPSTPAGR